MSCNEIFDSAIFLITRKFIYLQTRIKIQDLEGKFWPRPRMWSWFCAMDVDMIYYKLVYSVLKAKIKSQKDTYWKNRKPRENINKQWLERCRGFSLSPFHVVPITFIDIKCLILLRIHFSFGKDTKKMIKVKKKITITIHSY